MNVCHIKACQGTAITFIKSYLRHIFKITPETHEEHINTGENAL